MASTSNYHQQLKDLLAEQEWDKAQALWLDLAEQFSDQPEFLLLLIQEFVDAKQSMMAAELASLIAPKIKASSKYHEWLYALKLQANASPYDEQIRSDLLEAYHHVYQADARLKTILTAVQFDHPQTPLPVAIAKADTLLTLREGAYCQHKSWGVGRVKTFDTTIQRISVHFPHNPDHAMQLGYAAESLTPVSTDHIEVRKLTDLNALKQLATDDPVSLVRIVLLSHNRAATAAQLETTLSGSVIAPQQWKKWWETTRKLLKRDPHFELPAKKTDPIILRTAPVSQQDELLESFRNAAGLAQKTEAARQLLKLLDEIENPELLLQEFQDGLLRAISAAAPSRAAERLEAAAALEQLRSHQRTPAESTSALFTELLRDVRNLPGLLEELSGPALKSVLAAIKSSEPDRLLRKINELPAKALDEIMDILPQVADRIEQLVRNQSASAELLYWLGKNICPPQPRRSPPGLQQLRHPALAFALLGALESADTKQRKKLHDLLLDSDTLLPGLLADADTDTVRDVARRLLACSGLDELDRRSLMARLIKQHPFVQDFLVAKTTKEQPLIVSRASYQRRKNELDEILQKKIPQISKEIAQARSYGDLRENFEYKAAKDMQRLLLRRRAELERMLARAQPSDFAVVNTDTVQIGTTVTTTDLADNKTHTYHILGAWDSDPDRGIISYPAALAQALLNKRAGQTVEWTGEGGRQLLRIDRIEKVPSEILQSL